MRPRGGAGALIAIFVFAQLYHATRLGLSDDEAYYWVLGQSPAWGYAYHPPLTAWLIAACEAFFRSIGAGTEGTTGVFVARFPAIAISAALLALGLRWLRENGLEPARARGAALALLSFAGVYALSWMIVPDLPLFLALMISILAVDRIVTGRDRGLSSPIALAVGCALGILSKYSGAMIPFSAVLIAFAVTREATARKRILLAASLGSLAAAVPILAWNAETGWGSLLYQLKGRHSGGGFSAVRGFRFLVIQLALAGPLFFYSLRAAWLAIVRRPRDPRVAQLALWSAPALVIYGVQPWFAEFKPHWMLVAWFPFALLLALRSQSRDAPAADRRFFFAQIGHAALAFVLLGAILHSAWLPKIHRALRPEAEWNPLWDVSADFRGWDQLERAVPPGAVVLGSRYQTASQAAFALRGRNPVALVPRTKESRGEWPELTAVEDPLVFPPRIRETIFFVADARYSAAPELADAVCALETRIQPVHLGERGKWIAVYRCDPTVFSVKSN